MIRNDEVARHYINIEKDQYIKVFKANSDYMNGDVSCPQLHIHDEMELIYLFYGSLDVEVEDSKIRLEEGDLILINSFSAHSTRQVSERAKMAVCQFSLETIYNDGYSSFLNLISSTELKYYKFKAADKTRVERIVQSMLFIEEEGRLIKKDGKSISAYQSFLMKGNFYILFGLLCSEGVFEPGEDSKSSSNQKALMKVNTVLKYIREHYSEEITVAEAADLINVNASYFCRLFKKATGKTFIEYINYTRVMQAKQKLLDGNATITDVMYETGFSSYSYFNRTFKQYSGYSPTEYKTNFQNKKE